MKLTAHVHLLLGLRMSRAVLLLPLYAFVAYVRTRSHVQNSVPANCIEVCGICVCHSNTAEDSHLLGCYAMAIVALRFVTCCTIVINNIISYTTPVLEFFSVKI
jgi:hypothetical protein